jgi:hypothetical protein
VEENRRFDTLAKQVAANGDAERRLVLKIDVEGAEWDAFLSADDSVLDRIDQLVVEFHGVGAPKFLTAVQRIARHFYPVHLHFNNNACEPDAAPFPSLAYEVLFVNKRIGILDPSGAPVGLTPLDAANTTYVPDCQAAAP